MNRRDFAKLASTGTFSTLFLSNLVSENLFADEKSDSASEIGKDKLKKIADTSFDCIKKGEACLAFCSDRISEGDTSMKNCFKTIQNMMAICTAMAKVATSATAKPSAIRKLAGVCADLCKDCSENCKVHAPHHDVCKACMESCDHCTDACAKIA